MKISRLLGFGIAAGVFALDLLTKIIIRRTVQGWDTFIVIPRFFSIVHTENPGAAFSLLAAAQPEWRAFFLLALSGGALLIVAYLLWQPARRSSSGACMRIALALVMGGALGNLCDRIVRGTVTDFLEFYIGSYAWPAFNAADTAITVGAGLVILELVRSRSKQRTA